MSILIASRSIAIIISAIACFAVSAGQTPPATKERSHVDRFSSPEVRAERSESDATAKLSTNPNDDQALNSRSVARMRLGRYNEAFED